MFELMTIKNEIADELKAVEIHELIDLQLALVGGGGAVASLD